MPLFILWVNGLCSATLLAAIVPALSVHLSADGLPSFVPSPLDDGLPSFVPSPLADCLPSFVPSLHPEGLIGASKAINHIALPCHQRNGFVSESRF